MTDEKSEPACRWCREPAERHLGKLKLCPAGGALSFHAFTPAKPEAKEATDADFELRATCPHGFSYIEDCDRCPWSPGAKEVEQDTYGATMGRRYRLCWEGNARLRAELAVVTAERDAAIADRDLSSAAVETAWAEIDAMRPVVEAARSVVGKLLAEVRREGVTAQWAYKREYVALIDAIDALDAAKPAEPKQPPVCCVWARDGQCHIHGTTFGRNVGVLGVFETHPRAVAHVGAEIASWDAEPTPLPAERCHCGQHSMERPDIHSINWYWSKHTREACTLELPNVRCRCGRLRSEHIDGHAAPVTPPAVDPRDAADEWTDAKCDSYKTTTSSWGRYAMDAIKRRNAKIAELETILASTRETWNEQVQELEIDRDQQRARADDAEARCGEVAREQREACSDHIAQSSDSVARHFSRVVRGTPIVTDAKEKSK